MTISPRRVISAALLSIVSALLFSGWYAFGQRSTMRAETPQNSASSDQWEYLIVAGGNVSTEPGGYGSGRKQKVFGAEASAVERNLDLLGDDGWELVAVSGSVNQPTFFLKRPKRR